jgi:hypothetical protein
VVRRSGSVPPARRSEVRPAPGPLRAALGAAPVASGVVPADPEAARRFPVDRSLEGAAAARMQRWSLCRGPVRNQGRWLCARWERRLGQGLRCWQRPLAPAARTGPRRRPGAPAPKDTSPRPGQRRRSDIEPEGPSGACESSGGNENRASCSRWSCTQSRPNGQPSGRPRRVAVYSVASEDVKSLPGVSGEVSARKSEDWRQAGLLQEAAKPRTERQRPPPSL